MKRRTRYLFKYPRHLNRFNHRRRGADPRRNYKKRILHRGFLNKRQRQLVVVGR